VPSTAGAAVVWLGGRVSSSPGSTGGKRRNPDAKGSLDCLGP